MDPYFLTFTEVLLFLIQIFYNSEFGMLCCAILRWNIVKLLPAFWVLRSDWHSADRLTNGGGPWRLNWPCRQGGGREARERRLGLRVSSKHCLAPSLISPGSLRWPSWLTSLLPASWFFLGPLSEFWKYLLHALGIACLLTFTGPLMYMFLLTH